MAPFEHTLQATMGISAAEQFAQPAERKFVFDRIFKPTEALRVRDKFVRVLPAAEWTGAHGVAKHSSRFACDVLGDPVLRKPPNGNAESHRGTWLLDVAGAGHHDHFFPGRGESFEGVCFEVKTIDIFGRGGHFAAVREYFTHENPAAPDAGQI